MNSRRYTNRIKKELEVIIGNALCGITVYPKMNFPLTIEVTIMGPSGTPYEGGLFHLQIVVTDDYPFVAPDVVFLTRIFHPNIDEQGRICLDILKPLPAGSWRCTNTLMNVLLAIQQLLGTPNPYDPLCFDIAQLYLDNRELFNKTARKYTMMYAQSELPPTYSECNPVLQFDEESTDEQKCDDSKSVASAEPSPVPQPETKNEQECDDSDLAPVELPSPTLLYDGEGEEEQVTDDSGLAMTAETDPAECDPTGEQHLCKKPKLE